MITLKQLADDVGTEVHVAHGSNYFVPSASAQGVV